MDNNNVNPLTGGVDEMADGFSPSAPLIQPAVGRADGMDAEAAQAAQTAGVVGQTDAPDILAAYYASYKPSAMSAEGKKYIEELDAYFKERANGQVKLEQLSNPAGAYAAVAGSAAVIILFAQAIDGDENKPKINRADKAKDALTAKYPNIQVLNTLILTADDYAKAEAMAMHLLNVLLLSSSPEFAKITLASCLNKPFSFTFAPNVYKSFNEVFNPHGITARDDIKMTIFIDEQKNAAQKREFWHQDETERRPLATIAAYVDFVKGGGVPGMNANPAMPGAGMNFGGKFLPVIHISEIVSAVPADPLIPLYLSFAVNKLLDEQCWKLQFSDLSGKDKPNIGMLVPNSDGTFWRATTPQERENFINTWCAPATIVLDITEGRARIPGLRHYPQMKAQSAVIAQFNEFIAAAGQGTVAPLPVTAAVTSPMDFKYTGTIQLGPKTVDSRWCDYLSVMVHPNNVDYAKAVALLSSYPADYQAEIIRSLSDNLNLLYATHVSELVCDTIRAVQAAVLPNLKILDSTQVNVAADPSNWFANGARFQATPRGQVINSIYNPFARYY